MRRLIWPALTLLASWLLVTGTAAAQSTAHTTVTVNIPTVLRLRIDAAQPSDSQHVDFTIEGTNVTPDSIDVEVFSNASWKLLVQDGGGTGPVLAYRSFYRGSWSAWRTPQQSPVVAEDHATGGWKRIPAEFRLASQTASTSGKTTRTLLFTLTRP